MTITTNADLTYKDELLNKYLNNKSQKNFEALVLSYTGLAKRIAKKYTGYPVSVEDLQQEAILGLIVAVTKYNPDKKVQFSTFAYSNIVWALHNYITTSGMFLSVVTSKEAKKLFYNLKSTKQALNIMSDKMLTHQEVALIAKKLDVSEKNVILMDRFFHSSILTANREGEQIVDLLLGNTKNAEVSVSHKEIMNLYKKYFTHLDDREQYILKKVVVEHLCNAQHYSYPHIGLLQQNRHQ